MATSTNSIGTILKEARNAKGISLDEVHAKIKIHPRVLQLLEEDKFDKLPSPLFAKNFLRGYAEFLELNTDEILESYQKQGQKAAEQVLFIKTADEREHEGRSPSRGILGLILLFVIVGVVSAGSYLAFKPVSEFIGRMRLSDLTKKISLKKEAVAGKEALAVASKKAETKKDHPKKPNEWLRSVSLGNFPTLDPRAPLDLKVKAIDSVWLHITCDGKVLYQGILKRGAQETWNAKQTIEIWTGNASNIYLTLKGYPLGSPGKGVVKRMIISHEGVKTAPSQPSSNR